MSNDFLSELQMGLLRFGQKQNSGDHSIASLGRKNRRSAWVSELTNELNYSCDDFKFVDLLKILDRPQRLDFGDIEVRDFSGKTIAYLNIRCCADYYLNPVHNKYIGLPSLDMNYSRNLFLKENNDSIPRYSLLFGKSSVNDLSISMIGVLEIKEGWSIIEGRKNWRLAAHSLGDNEWKEFYKNNSMSIVEIEAGAKLRLSA